MKKIIKKIINKFGFDIRKLNTQYKQLSFDEIYKNKIKNNPIIFDVGANNGQSIIRFKEIFPKSIIHAFEPVNEEFNLLKEKFNNDKSIILNNLAIGEKNTKKNFYIAAKTGNSSFNKLKLNTGWLQRRSKQYKTTLEGYTQKTTKTIITLDAYCQKNHINFIDLLKIDTQGYEDKVLEGAQKLLKNNLISAIEAEIMFDNVYERYLSFSDIEKYLLPNNFRFCGIRNYYNNLFEEICFFADLLYFNKKYFNLD